MYVYMYWRTHLHKHIHVLTGTDKFFTLTCYVIVFTMVSSFPWAFLKALVHLVFRGLRFLLNALWHFDRQNLKIWYQPRNNIVSLHRQWCQLCIRPHLEEGKIWEITYWWVSTLEGRTWTWITCKYMYMYRRCKPQIAGGNTHNSCMLMDNSSIARLVETTTR